MAIKILVVDDEPRVREVLAALLVSLGHEVVESPSGADTLTRLEAGERVDFVLTDLMMPGIKGGELARRIKARWPSLSVGIISGDEIALAQHEGDADLVLAKPVTREQLAERLRSLPPRPPR
jgi:CheY-like chemotaxis protein